LYQIKGKVTESDAKFVISDTRMQVLPEVLKSKRRQKKKIDFSYISPEEGSDRTGVLETKRKNIHNRAMYPRMCL
jgi:hypothetical protein